MHYNTIQLGIDPRGIATLVLNRPDTSNAFNAEMIREMTDAIARCATDTAVRALILRSSGRHFSAGADIHWMRSMAGMSFAENRADAVQLSQLMRSLHEFPAPTIARITGASYGGALGLITCCDMAFASDDATFCLSEVRLGLVPAVISPYVIRAIGERASRRYFLTGEIIDVAQAEKLGLIYRAGSPEALDGIIHGICESVLKNGPVATQEAKRLLQQVAGLPLNDELRDQTIDLIARLRVSREGQEGLNSFLEKRKPDWSK